MKTQSRRLRLDLIRSDGGTQPRARIDPLVVADYADAYRAGHALPAVSVFYDGADYWLADGFHRLAAAKQAGRRDIQAEVRQGTRREAVLFSVGANTAHGLRRTNDDKRRAVLTLLADSEWRRWSNREIARRCAVSNRFVGLVRAELSVNGSQIDDGRRQFERGGRVQAMQTGKINAGRRNGNGSAAPTLAPEAVEIIRHTPLADNRRVVERLAGLSPEMQVEIAQRLDGGAANVREAVGGYLREQFQPRPVAPSDGKKKRAAGWPRLWRRVAPNVLLINANAGAVIPVASESVDCIVCSPPYWGMRDYAGEQGMVWGGAPACRHAWSETLPPRYPGQIEQSKWPKANGPGRGPLRAAGGGRLCRKCGAWLGALGLEPTPELYTQHMTTVLREARRILRPHGTLWMVSGDSYASGKSRYSSGAQTLRGKASGEPMNGKKPDIRGHPALKDKDLAGVPWRVAFAAQGFAAGFAVPGSELNRAADLLALAREKRDWKMVAGVEAMLRGWAALSHWIDPWWVRAEIIWHKPNSRPESTADRPTRDFEVIFVLARAGEYYFDADAIKEAYAKPMNRWGGEVSAGMATKGDGRSPYESLGQARVLRPDPDGRRKRSVWNVDQPELDSAVMSVNTRPFHGVHFAPFPVELVEPCVLAGTSQAGNCPKCGRPYERVVARRSPVIGVDIPLAQRETDDMTFAGGAGHPPHEQGECGSSALRVSKSENWTEWKEANPDQTLGWQPSCECYGHFEEIAGDLWDEGLGESSPVRLFVADRPLPEPRPAVVADIFCGTGATGVAALRHGRRFVGVDLSFPYMRELAKERLAAASEMQSGA